MTSIRVKLQHLGDTRIVTAELFTRPCRRLASVNVKYLCWGLCSYCDVEIRTNTSSFFKCLSKFTKNYELWLVIINVRTH